MNLLHTWISRKKALSLVSGHWTELERVAFGTQPSVAYGYIIDHREKASRRLAANPAL